MPSKTVVKHARDSRAKIVAALQRQYISHLKTAAKKIEIKQRQDYGRTVRGWQGYRGGTAYDTRRPLVKFETKIVMVGLEPYVVLRSWMSDSTGAASQVWYWLDQGREMFEQPETSPPLLGYVLPKTIPGSLDTQTRGYSGDTFVIPAGAIVDAITPRGWTNIILSGARRQASLNGLRVVNAEIEGL